MQKISKARCFVSCPSYTPHGTTLKMDLLHFAHGLEARPFLEHFKHNYVQAPFSGVYKTQDFFILISGEGEAQGLTKLSAWLGQEYQNIQSVINLGAAGSLHEKYKRGDCLSIRQAYHQNSFHSFATNDLQARVDIVSSQSRILKTHLKRELSPIAELVDREAHSAGLVAGLFKKKFFSLKVITDETEEETQCQQVREEFAPLGEKLLDSFLLHYPRWKSEAASPLEPFHSENQNPLELSDELFYFTTAQANRLNAYRKKLGSDKFLQLENSLRQQLSLKTIRPKQRTESLLKSIHAELYPQASQLVQKAEQIVHPLKQAGWEVAWERDWERASLQLKTTVESIHDIAKLKTGLSRFSWETWDRFIQGELDCEDSSHV